MRIAYAANIRFPSERAHAIQIVHMCNAFASLGHDVTLYVTSRATSVEEDGPAYYGVPFAFEVERIAVPPVVTYIHSFPRALHPFLFMVERFFFALNFTLRASRDASLIYCRDEWVLWFVSLFTKTQILWESHEAKYNLPARRLLHRYPAIAISDGIKERYLELGVAPDAVHVAHDGIDDAFFRAQQTKSAARHALGLPLDASILMYIGGLDPWKGVTVLFDAAERIGEAMVVVIGGSAEQVERYRREYPRVRFLGSRPYKDLPMHQRAADILVVPNTGKNLLSAAYTSPLKLFAHMTSGVPILLSDIASLRAILPDDAGYYFAPDDAASLASKAREILEDPTGARARSERALSLSREYTWQRRAEGIIDFFNKKY